MIVMFMYILHWYYDEDSINGYVVIYWYYDDCNING